MLKKLYFVALIIFSVSGCDEVTSPYPEIIPEAKKEAPDVAIACGTAFTIDNTAYITLGRKASYRGLSTDCYAYNPEEDTWTPRSDFPGAARVFPVSAVVDGKAYVGLGYNYKGVYNDSAYMRDFWMYDPVDDSWSRKADFPAFSSNHAASFVYNDEIYVIHGFGSDAFNRRCWKYAPNTNEWTQLADFPGYPRTSAVVCTDGSRIFSGTGYGTWNENDWWEYYPDSDQWRKKKKMPDSGRINALAFSLNNRFFVATGRFFAGAHTGGHLKSDIMEYDAGKNVWYHRGDIPARENAVCFIINNRVYIAFGENEDNILSDVWSFQP